MFCRSWHVGLSLLLCALPLRALAQHAPSAAQIAAGEQLLAAGEAAYEQGRLREALEDFEQAYGRIPRPALLYRIGDIADKLGEHGRAVAALEEYLTLVPAAADRDFIEGRIEANRAALRAAAATGVSPRAAAQAGADSQASGSAAQGPGPEVATSSTAPAPAAGSPLRSVWLWAGAGVAVVAGVVVVALLVGGSGTQRPKPIHGDVGGVVETLGAPP